MRQPAELGGGDQAGGRARQQQFARMARPGGDAHQAAVRLHDEQLRRHDAARAQPLGEAREVALDAGPHIGVDHGGRQPVVFAQHRQHDRRHRDPHPGRLLGDDLGGAPLVIGTQERKQVADRDRGHAARHQPSCGGAHLGLGERGQDLAAEIHPLGDLLGQTLRHQHRRLDVERIDQVAAGRLGPAARLVDRPKAARDQEARGRALVLEQRIGGDRGAVREEPHFRRIDVLPKHLLERTHHRLRGIARHRRHLGEAGPAARWFNRDQVGEGAAGVDADHPGGHRLAPRPARARARGRTSVPAPRAPDWRPPPSPAPE